MFCPKCLFTTVQGHSATIESRYYRAFIVKYALDYPNLGCERDGNGSTPLVKPQDNKDRC